MHRHHHAAAYVPPTEIGLRRQSKLHRQRRLNETAKHDRIRSFIVERQDRAELRAA